MAEKSSISTAVVLTRFYAIHFGLWARRKFALFLFLLLLPKKIFFPCSRFPVSSFFSFSSFFSLKKINYFFFVYSKSVYCNNNNILCNTLHMYYYVIFFSWYSWKCIIIVWVLALLLYYAIEIHIVNFCRESSSLPQLRPLNCM